MSKKTLKVTSSTHAHALEAKKRLMRAALWLQTPSNPDQYATDQESDWLDCLNLLCHFTHAEKQKYNTGPCGNSQQANICDSSYSVTSSAENVKCDSIKVKLSAECFQNKSFTSGDRTEYIKMTTQALISVNRKTQTCSNVDSFILRIHISRELRDAFTFTVSAVAYLTKLSEAFYI